jgi:hypothetical protein
LSGRGKAIPANCFHWSNILKINHRENCCIKNLKAPLSNRLTPFKIESLECCIYFVSTFTFATAKIFTDKIEVHFGLGRKIKSQRINQCVQLPANGYLYYVTINTTDEIDDTLMEWIKEAQNKKTEKAVTV